MADILSQIETYKREEIAAAKTLRPWNEVVAAAHDAPPVRRFLSALHGRAIPPDTRLTRQQRIRLRRMLRAFDGHRAGATQQEIAQVILKIGPLDRDEWQASSARHTIKALLRDAHSMVAGGYRKLLRHRRQR